MNQHSPASRRATPGPTHGAPSLRILPPVTALAVASLLLVSCTSAPAPQASSAPEAPATAVPEIRPGILAGYLAADAIPDSLALVPAPPATGTAALAQDHAVMRAALALRGTPRFEQARHDAELDFPFAAGTFACALGTGIDAQRTPATYRLLRRTLTDAALSTRAAKARYERTRPFVETGEPTCTPEDEADLRGNGSYPSGHTAIGWTWALVLTQAAPERSNALLARGRSFGESRLVCNVHWQSDVLQGRFMASGTFARLQSDPAYRADVAAAAKELAEVRAQGVQPDRDCAAEAAALAQPLPGVL
ncbi:acid phosphatase [Pseudoxanthomonas koreensis]|uniref:acid phosphatase n=1 Tax=Pseudoxanthomonas koreensis TaxID=266061 RepID=UPI001391F464|nr:phosphatase PAP2 family protein [Pseudoxanthomonas koreensis]KAF1693615.1 acid phosphatase [Pseudoxanthomonas koreensis]